MIGSSVSTVWLVGAGSQPLPECLEYLEHEYAVRSTYRLKEMQSWLARQELPDAVVCAETLDDATGIEALAMLRVYSPHTLRVLVLRDPTRGQVLSAINDAAVYQILSLPVQPEQLALTLRRALESRELSRIHRYLSRELKFADAVIPSGPGKATSKMIDKPASKDYEAVHEIYQFDKLVFVSEQMAKLCNLARKAAATDLPVLIEGETGTGKELMARAIHLFSPRKDQMFLAQNCGAIAPELLLSELFGHVRGAFSGAISDRSGLFLAAHQGTVFLDEIADISPQVQVALLRFLQDGEIKPVGGDKVKNAQVRIVAASNRSFQKLVKAGTFREDLFYRLNGFSLQLPPLRERPEDIPVLADYMVKKYSEKFARRVPGFASLAMQKLRSYAFPGNVRELENHIRRLVATAEDGEFITVAHLPVEIAAVTLPRPSATHPESGLDGVPLKDRIESLEMGWVSKALEAAHWNHTRAAQSLGLSRVGLANKIKRYNIAKQSEA